MQHDYLSPQKRRLFFICSLACGLGVISTGIAKTLLVLISFFTNLFYFQRISFDEVAAGDHSLGWLSIFIPAVGGLIIGGMAKYGSPAIRGHGIPEAMENILLKNSRIPKRITILKPFRQPSPSVQVGLLAPRDRSSPPVERWVR